MNNDVKVSDMDNILFKDEIIPETKEIAVEESNIEFNSDLMNNIIGIQQGRFKVINIPSRYLQKNDWLKLQYTRGSDGEYYVTIYRDLPEVKPDIPDQLNKQFSSFDEFKNNVVKMIEEFNNKFKMNDEIIPETKVRAEREKLDINNEKSKQYEIKKKEELQKLVNDISDADIKMIKDEIEKVIVDTNDKLARGIIEDFISRVYIANHYPDLSNTSAEEVYYMLRKKIKE